MGVLRRQRWADYSWRIEEYQRGLKQHCGVERCQARGAQSQRNHIGLSLRAFLRLSAYCRGVWVTWFEQKRAIIREAVRA